MCDKLIKMEKCIKQIIMKDVFICSLKNVLNGINLISSCCVCLQCHDEILHTVNQQLDRATISLFGGSLQKKKNKHIQARMKRLFFYFQEYNLIITT